MIIWILLFVIVITVGGSITSLFREDSAHRQHFSIEHFYTLVVVYLVVMVGFGMVYYVLASEGWVLLDGEILQKDTFLERIGHAVYFSGVTLMTIGYGDITPIGIGRFIALAEALIGYILPAAFFVQMIYDANKESE